MYKNAIVSFLLDLNDKHDFFDADWQRRLALDAYYTILEENDIELKKKVELEKQKTIIKLKAEAFRKYIDFLQGEEKRQFLEVILGKNASANFLEDLSNYQLYVIDGQSRFLEPGPEGTPKINKVDPSKIVTCDRGFHVLGGWCNCNIWTTCPIRKPEYEEWLGLHGTESEKRKYIDSQSKVAAYL